MNALKEIMIGRRSAGFLEVLVDSESRRRPHEFAGRTTGNTVVNFAGEPDWVGRFARVEIERAGPNSLAGRVLEIENERRGTFTVLAR